MNDVDEIINQISSKMKYLSNFQKKKSNQNYHSNMNDLIDFQKKNKSTFIQITFSKCVIKHMKLMFFSMKKCYSKLFEMYLIIRQYVKS